MSPEKLSYPKVTLQDCQGNTYTNYVAKLGSKGALSIKHQPPKANEHK